MGKEVEDGLAEYLGVEQGLIRKSVDIEFQSEQGQFAIDFNQVLKHLRKVRRGLNKPSPNVLTRLAFLAMGRRNATEGEKLVQHFMRLDRYESGPKPIVIGTKGNLEIVMQLGRVGHRFEYDNGQKSESHWEANGAVLMGPLDTDYSNKNLLVEPTISFTIRKQSKEEYSRLPILDPKEKQLAEDLASKIVSAFS